MRARASTAPEAQRALRIAVAITAGAVVVWCVLVGAVVRAIWAMLKGLARIIFYIF